MQTVEKGGEQRPCHTVEGLCNDGNKRWGAPEGGLYAEHWDIGGTRMRPVLLGGRRSRPYRMLFPVPSRQYPKMSMGISPQCNIWGVFVEEVNNVFR
jgi:hypothetical protein